MLYINNDRVEVEQNLQRAQGKWGRLENILGREGADKITVERFYVAVVQAMILFGYDTWVLTPRLYKSLKVFHLRAERRMAVMVPKLQRYGTWVYPPIGVDLAMVVLEDIGVYISCR